MTKKLTQKTFLLLAALSLTVCFLAYGCIWFFLPYADKKQAGTELEEKTGQLADGLRTAKKQESEALFLEFIRDTGADLCLTDGQGQHVSLFTFQNLSVEDSFCGMRGIQNGVHGIKYPFKFTDSKEEYMLTVWHNPARSQEIANAILHSMPYVVLATLFLSFASAWVFSCYTTRPIMRIHKIAGKMAKLDFSWYCPDLREDEIGMLSKSINELSDRLHAALGELHRRNAHLEDEILIEKERERRRMLFFSGISHELKTPVAIVIGQLEGMQAGIGVYKDREKYLARSTEILYSLNRFLKEILLVSHIDMSKQEEAGTVGLSGLLDSLLLEYAGYAEFSSVQLHGDITQGLCAYGEEMLLKKAVGNIIGNAITHSPPNAAVELKLYPDGSNICLCVENTPAHIEEEHLPHLFEAFYRADASAGHGSGLGLYITRMILEAYHIPHAIQNTADGVQFTAVFRCL